MGKQIRRDFEDERGSYQIVSGSAHDMNAALGIWVELADYPPEGYHLWSGKVQRSDRGRRSSYEVWYRKTKSYR